jgi:hypothetical protein
MSTKQFSNPIVAVKRPRGKQAGGAPAKSKIEKVIALMRRPNGARLAELMRATGWQAHTVRGAISSAVRGRRGLSVASEAADGVTIYRIASEEA